MTESELRASIKAIVDTYPQYGTIPVTDFVHLVTTENVMTIARILCLEKENWDIRRLYKIHHDGRDLYYTSLDAIPKYIPNDVECHVCYRKLK